MFVSSISVSFLLLFCCAFASFPCDPGYGVGDSGDCVICKPESFDQGRGSCVPCEPGNFQTEVGQTECDRCPPNSHSLRAATECVSCPDGQAVMHTNTCGTCPPGKYYEDGSCHPCGFGFFKTEEGISPCMPCPGNSYSKRESSRFISCPEGEAPMEDSSCGKCPPGEHYDKYLFKCFVCYPGTYTDSPNVLDRCYRCGRNSYAVKGSSKCIECPAGQVYVNSSGTCEKCGAGKFYDRWSLSCSECPYNEFSVYENEPECTYCMPGTFAKRGSTTCFPCPLGQVYIAETDQCEVCPQSSYRSYNRSAARCITRMWN